MRLSYREYKEYQQKFEYFMQRNKLGNISDDFDYYCRAYCPKSDDCEKDDCYVCEHSQDVDRIIEPHFSWSNCDICGAKPGDRYIVSGYIPSKKEISATFSICPDCYYYSEYGQLDDMTMGDMRIPEEGESISHATLRENDLIEAFMKALEYYDPSVYDDMLNIQLEIDSMEGGIDKLDAISWFINEDLFNALNDLAPYGCYFGSNEGDGADFGFWGIYVDCSICGETRRIDQMCEAYDEYDSEAVCSELCKFRRDVLFRKFKL